MAVCIVADWLMGSYLSPEKTWRQIPDNYGCLLREAKEVVTARARYLFADPIRFLEKRTCGACGKLGRATAT